MSQFIDTISIKRAEEAHPKNIEELLYILEHCNTKVLTGRSKLRYSYVLRTFSVQDSLYLKGRRGIKGEKKVTNAKGGYSFHNYGFAVDIVLLIDHDNNGTYTEASWDTIKDFDNDAMSDWMEVVEIFRKFGWIWGGDWDNDGSSADESFVDKPHFQKTHGLTINECLRRYKNKMFEAKGSPYVKL